MNSRERVFAVLRGQTVDRVPLMPITMMFAAHHIGKPYGRYALDHELLVEAQLKTAEDFGFDHVSTITETREAPDCGAPVRIFEDQPYALDGDNALLAEKSALLRLKAPEPRSAPHMSDRLEALTMLKQRAGAERIVEGWVEGACGGAADLRGINTLMLDFFDDPGFVRDLMEFVVALGIEFGRAQVEAGADVVGLGDPAASLVGPQVYREFVWPFERRLVDGLRATGALVRLHVCGNTRRILTEMGELGCDIVDVDSMVPMSEARAAMGPDQVLLGGIDPVRVLQNGAMEQVLSAVHAAHQDAGMHYILGAGCEVPPDTPPQNLMAFYEYSTSGVRDQGLGSGVSDSDPAR